MWHVDPTRSQGRMARARRPLIFAAIVAGAVLQHVMVATPTQPAPVPAPPTAPLQPTAPPALLQHTAPRSAPQPPAAPRHGTAKRPGTPAVRAGNVVGGA